jgi:hypothetical protein
MRMRIWAAAAAAVSVLLAAPSQGAQVTVGAAKDATIFGAAVNNSNGGGPGVFSGADGSNNVLRALFQFDVAGAVPAGSTVTGADLTLYLGQVAGAGGGSGDATPRVIDLRRVAADWGESTNGSGASTIGGTSFPARPGDATWNARMFGAAAWSTLGGDFAATPSGSTTVGQTLGNAYIWASTAGIVADVQGWLDDPAGNHGWLLLNLSEAEARTFRAFWTHEAANAALRPQLVITYTPVPEPTTVLTPMALLALALGRRRAR